MGGSFGCGVKLYNITMFSYRWTLANASFTKDKGKVFSCFAGGGGSTMGYKLAGFDVLGCNEIDPKMARIYQENHHPKYLFNEPIQEFKNKDLPEELYNLDILDGSPPCSSFSMFGNREKDWGRKKKFHEGQQEQVLDTLFFDFIELARKLKPKVIVAENVKGLMLGNARKYLGKIKQDLTDSGYYVKQFLLNAASMGVPQSRERLFLICLRNDLAPQFLEQEDLFSKSPALNLTFRYPHIPYKEIRVDHGTGPHNLLLFESEMWSQLKPGQPLSDMHPKGNYFGHIKLDPNKPVPTISANSHHIDSFAPRHLFSEEFILASSFPIDYNFLGVPVIYVVGMSVPPVMIAHIACEIYSQWIKKI